MEVSQMAQQWNWLNIPMRPALPPPPTTADVYEPAGGEAYILEMHVPGVKPEEIAIEAIPRQPRVSTDPQQLGIVPTNVGQYENSRMFIPGQNLGVDLALHS